MLRRNVLIFHSGALGDFILTWPFAVAMGRIYPQSRIIYVTASSKGALAEKVLRLESTDSEAGWHQLFSESPELLPRALSMLNGAHTIYSFAGVHPLWSKNIKQFNAEAKLVELDPTPPEDFAGHATDWIVHQLAGYTIEQSATEQILRSIDDRGIGFRTVAGSGILIHPGSGSKEKNWPIDRFIDLAHQLRSDRKVRFIIGEVEREQFGEGQLKKLKATAPVVSPNSYLELLSEISSADLFIGNDTGPSHLAGMIGIPTISLFGPTLSNQWAPRGPRVRVISAPALDQIPINSVLKTVREIVDLPSKIEVLVADDE